MAWGHSIKPGVKNIDAWSVKMIREDFKTHYICENGITYKCETTRHWEFRRASLKAFAKLGLLDSDVLLLEWFIDYIDSGAMDTFTVSEDVAYFIDYGTLLKQVGYNMIRMNPDADFKHHTRAITRYITDYLLPLSYTDGTGKVRHILIKHKSTDKKTKHKKMYFSIDWCLLNFIFKDPYNTKQIAEREIEYLPSIDTAKRYNINREAIISDVKAMVSRSELIPYDTHRTQITPDEIPSNETLLSFTGNKEYSEYLTQRITGKTTPITNSDHVPKNDMVVPKSDNKEQYLREVKELPLLKTDKEVVLQADMDLGDPILALEENYDNDIHNKSNILKALQSLNIPIKAAEELVSTMNYRRLEAAISLMQKNISNGTLVKAPAGYLKTILASDTIDRVLNIPLSIPSEHPVKAGSLMEQVLKRAKLEEERNSKPSVNVTIHDEHSRSSCGVDSMHHYLYRCECNEIVRSNETICKACNSNISFDNVDILIQEYWKDNPDVYNIKVWTYQKEQQLSQRMRH
jgi:hypothetical protein